MSAWTRVGVALGLLLALSGSRAGAAEQEAVAVMEFSSKGGVTQDQMDALSDLLANQIRALGVFRVIGKSDIRAMLSLEDQKARLGSCDDQGCLAEIGGALGVKYVVAGNVSLFGTTYLLNLKLIDVRKAQVLGGVSRSLTSGQDALVAELPKATQELMAQVPRETPSGASPSADATGAAPAPPAPPIPPTASVTLAEPKQEKPEEGTHWRLLLGGAYVTLIGGHEFGDGSHKTDIQNLLDVSVHGFHAWGAVGLDLVPWLTVSVDLGGGYALGRESDIADRSAWFLDLTGSARFRFLQASSLHPVAMASGGLSVKKDNDKANDWSTFSIGPCVHLGAGLDWDATDRMTLGLLTQGMLWVYDVTSKDGESGDPDASNVVWGLSVQVVTTWRL